jgi:hypothetical protein
VQVTISQGKKTIATTAAKLVERAEKAPRSAVVLDTSSGTRSITELQLAGKQTALVFEPMNTAQKQGQ